MATTTPTLQDLAKAVKDLELKLEVANSDRQNQKEEIAILKDKRDQELSARRHKIGNPPVFGGTKGDLKGHLTQVRAHFEYFKDDFTNEEAKILFASSFLEKDALRWFEPYKNDFLTKTKAERRTETDDIFESFSAYEEGLSKVFGEQDEERKAADRLAQLKQKGSAAQYASAFRQDAFRVGWDDDALIDCYYRGLKDDVKDEISQQDRGSDVDEYIARSIRIDDRQYQRRQEKGHQPRQVPRPNSGRKRYHKYGTHISGTTHAGPMEVDITQKNHPKKNSRPLKCFRCGGEGHFARDCKEKPRIGWKPIPEPKRVAMVETEEVSHESLSWTTCYDDDCATHRLEKEGGGWWPREPRARNPNRRRSLSVPRDWQMVACLEKGSTSFPAEGSRGNTPEEETGSEFTQEGTAEAPPHEIGSTTEEEDLMDPWLNPGPMNELNKGFWTTLEQEMGQEGWHDNDRMLVKGVEFAPGLLDEAPKLAETLSNEEDAPQRLATHRAHWAIAWFECTTNTCRVHLADKIQCDCFPVWTEPRGRLYYHTEEQCWEYEACNPADEPGVVDYYFSPKRARPECCVEGGLVEDCPSKKCIFHYEEKVDQWHKANDKTKKRGIMLLRKRVESEEGLKELEDMVRKINAIPSVEEVSDEGEAGPSQPSPGRHLRRSPLKKRRTDDSKNEDALANEDSA